MGSGRTARARTARAQSTDESSRGRASGSASMSRTISRRTAGWVDDVGTQYGAVAVGEENTTPYNNGPQIGNEFPLVCQNVMPVEARWMWFNWDPQNIEWPHTAPDAEQGAGYTISLVGGVQFRL